MCNLRLSVVIPLFNKQSTIRRALESIFSQTYTNFEIVVVDDGSTDGSSDEVLQINDPRLCLIKQSNSGASVARNRGIAATTGDYICLLDADDEWMPDHLQHISELIADNPFAGLYSSRYKVVLPNGLPKIRFLGVQENFRGQIPDFFRTYTESRSLLNSSTVCIRRACFEEVGGFPPGKPVGEDVFMWLKIAEKHPVMFDARVAVIIYQDAPNRTSNRHKPVIPYYLHHYLNRVDLKTLPVSLRTLLASYTSIYAASAVQRGNRTLPLQYAKLVWPIAPKIAVACLFMSLVPKQVIDLLQAIKQRDRSIAAKRN